jgi:hypothetical protein
MKGKILSHDWAIEMVGQGFPATTLGRAIRCAFNFLNKGRRTLQALGSLIALSHGRVSGTRKRVMAWRFSLHVRMNGRTLPKLERA